MLCLVHIVRGIVETQDVTIDAPDTSSAKALVTTNLANYENGAWERQDIRITVECAPL